MEMELKCQKHFVHLVSCAILILYLSLFISKAEAYKIGRAMKSNVSAVFALGDSTVDSGNNNYINTALRCNFSPYGRDLPDHMPTGRFSNGRLATDFVASYVGVKDFVPPYLNPILSINDLLTGVSFASGGSGYDPLTADISNVISTKKQLDYLKAYKKRLQYAIGMQRMEDHINKALFLLSAGTNDHVITYYGVSSRSRSYTISAYQEFLLQQVTKFIQGLLKEGARRIGVVGLPPMGCLPIVITLYSNNAISNRGCIEKFSTVARNYNLMLQNLLDSMQHTLALNYTDAKIYYVDIYSPLSDMINGINKSGFKEVSSGCCGTGYLEAALLCHPSYVCSDASKYIFWDSIHPSEKTYYEIFKAIRPTVDLLIQE